MTKAEARRIVCENLIDMMRALGISAWRIDVSYVDLNREDRDGFKRQMSTNMQPRYEHALIKIDPDSIDTDKYLLHCLRHELIHIMLSPFWSYDDDVRQMMPPLDSMSIRTLDQFYHNRFEALVLCVERMFDHGLGKTAKQLVTTARRRWSDE